MKNHIPFSTGEEIANAISHGLGILLSIAALVILIIGGISRGDIWYTTSTIIYGSSLILLYFSSTLYHSLPHGKAKNVFERFDHIAIFILIAGCYTPFALTVLRDSYGWLIFGVVWGITVVGTIFKAIFIKKYKATATLFYILMGWIIILDIKNLLNALSSIGIWLLVLGGVSYSVGTIFYLFRLFKYNHFVWHIFVLTGSVLHFFVIAFYI